MNLANNASSQVVSPETATVRSTLLFLDDHFLASSENVSRVMHQPGLEAVSDMTGAGNTWGCAFPSVFYDEEREVYRLWYQAARFAPNCDWHLYYGESTDGWNFKPAVVSAEKLQPGTPILDPNLPRPANAVFWWPPTTYGADVWMDRQESDPQARFKMAFINGPDWFCGLAYSPDGFAWTPDLEHPFYPKGEVSDTSHPLRFNSSTGRYQMMVRPGHGDRRVALIESSDLKTWTDQRLIFGPDENDSAAAQLYSMPVFPYDGIWLGLLWVMDTPPEQRGAACGPINVQLTWSYDGLNWTRGPREPFIPIRKEGEYGHGAVEASSLLLDGDGNIRIYANGFLVDHKEVFPVQKAGTPPSQLLAYSLRRDGFMSLRAGEQQAHIVSKALECDPLNIYVNGFFSGELKAQLCGENGKALKGFSFADCTPLRGDHTCTRLIWHGKKPASQAPQKLSVALQWTNGDLFSLRFE